MSRERYRFGHKVFDKRQKKWEDKKNLEQNNSFHFSPEFTPMAYSILLLAYYTQSTYAQSTKKPLEHAICPVENNIKLSEDNAVCPIPQISKFSENKKYSIPDPTLLTVLPAPKQQEEKRLLSTLYASYFKAVPNVNIPVEFHPTVSHFIESLNAIGMPVSSLEKKFTEARLLIQKTLSKLKINPEVMANIKKTNLTIYVTEDVFIEEKGGWKAGFYSPKENAISISVMAARAHDLTSTLLNELNHAGVAIRNFMQLQKKPADMLDLGLPFIDDKGNISQKQLHKLTLAHQEFQDNFVKFERLHQKKSKKEKWDPEQRMFLTQVETAIIEHYNPLKHAFSRENYEALREQADIKKYSDLSEKITLPGARLSFHFYFYDTHPFFNFVHPDDQRSVIDSFIYDIQKLNKLYTIGAYSKKPENQRLAEYSSHIDQISPEIKTLLAPKWCQYFSNFHKVENYCASEAENSQKPKIR